MSSTDTPPSPNPSAKGTTVEPECEVRFAVVMYGGVSLAIYINGIAQELLSLVRATAPSKPNSAEPLLTKERLVGAAGVYRRLGQFLAERDPKKCLEQLTAAEPKDARITTRFIVDVISGTSAGGINGVFLAKALAEEQTMNGLKQLWLEEGDLEKLLNDKRSIKGLSGFKVKRPPESLLNSQRMYRKLLEALAQMDSSVASSSVYPRAPGVKPSPLLSELDLFTTTTDIEGLPLPVGLSDRLVFERRYKNVFHFRYADSGKRNDFTPDNDPFLAFAARCTSSFPFAFEPTSLKDCIDIAQNHPRYFGAKNQLPEWDGFFSEYLRLGLVDLDRDSRDEQGIGEKTAAALEKMRNDMRDAFAGRAFGDGGYLDNKPFTYATATLMHRIASCETKRKLLYIEPSPEHPELLRANPETPDFLANVRAAVLDLPRQETIREDIARLQERNRVVNRLNVFAQEVDADIVGNLREPMDKDAFRKGDVTDAVKHYNLGYGPYHRLVVGEITSFLAEVVSRAKGHDPDSNAGIAIRELIAAWRRDNYALRHVPGKATENEFLFTHDLHYRFRRVIFLMRRVDLLLRADFFSDSKENRHITDLLSLVLKHARKNAEPQLVPRLDSNFADDVERWLKLPQPTANHERMRAWAKGFRSALEHIKAKILVLALEDLRETEGALLNLRPMPNAPDPFGAALNDLYEWLQNIKLPWPRLKEILNLNDGARQKQADELYQTKSQAFIDAAAAFRGVLDSKQPHITDKVLKLSDQPPYGSDLPGVMIPDADQGVIAAQLCLLYYNKNFIWYDMVVYPVEYGTGAGETVEVEIFRVSPEDAPSLLDEKPDDERTRKLAGRAVMSFGAFFDESWRRNDMLWGRLDGAERLITALLPLPKIDESQNEKEREEKEKQYTQRLELIREAHLGILTQEINEGNTEAVCRLLSHALAHTPGAEPCGQQLRGFINELIAKNRPQLNQDHIATLTSPETMDRQLEPRRALEYISRSTNISGDMLSGLSEKYQFEPGKRASGWMARVGTILWYLVAVAIPQSLASLFFRHWLGLLYFVAFALIIVGVSLNNPVKFAGWQFLAIVIAIHLVVTTLGAYLRGRYFRKLLRVIFALVLLGLLSLGVLKVISLFRGQELDQTKEFLIAAAVAFGIVVLAGIAAAMRAAINWFATLSRQSLERTRDRGRTSPKRPA